MSRRKNLDKRRKFPPTRRKRQQGPDPKIDLLPEPNTTRSQVGVPGGYMVNFGLKTPSSHFGFSVGSDGTPIPNSAVAMLLIVSGLICVVAGSTAALLVHALIVTCVVIGIGAIAMGAGFVLVFSSKNRSTTEPAKTTTIEATVIPQDTAVITTVPSDSRRGITTPEATTPSTEANADSATEPPVNESALTNKPIVESNRKHPEPQIGPAGIVPPQRPTPVDDEPASR